MRGHRASAATDWGTGVTQDGQDKGIGCGCEDHVPLWDSHPDSPSDSDGSSRRRFLRTAAGLAIGAPALLAAACSSSSSPSPSGQKTKANGEGDTPPPASSASPSAGTPSQTFTPPPRSSNGRLAGPETADAALLAAKYRGLKPFAPAPPPPATKPVDTNVPLPPVIDHIPTDQKICFLTIDDGGEKDPAFLAMVKDFRIPFTMFLADCFIRTDYEYFAKLRDTGYSTIQNHTQSHPNMVTLSAQRQLAEITGQQQKLQKTYNTTPYLFRAPFGNSNQATQQACKQNGIKAICYWRASFQKQGFQWQAADKKLRPGDILLAHFRGPHANGAGWPQMHELMTNLFRIVQEQGFTFARLEDYV
jgi:peptidoglycan/xylan/chitin deacetylase (PgdA/CDA1 family)